MSPETISRTLSLTDSKLTRSQTITSFELFGLKPNLIPNQT